MQRYQPGTLVRLVIQRHPRFHTLAQSKAFKVELQWSALVKKNSGRFLSILESKYWWGLEYLTPLLGPQFWTRVPNFPGLQYYQTSGNCNLISSATAGNTLKQKICWSSPFYLNQWALWSLISALRLLNFFLCLWDVLQPWEKYVLF